MSMCHKAYRFDWHKFDQDLRPILESALASDDPSELVRFVNQNLEDCKDPYEGEPLGDEWQEMLQSNDVQEVADFALTKYYEPAEDNGIHELYTTLALLLSDREIAGLLGRPVGSP